MKTKTTIIAAVCISVLVPVRVAVMNSSGAAVTVEGIAQEVTATVSDGVAQAKQSVRLGARSAAQLISQTAPECAQTVVTTIVSAVSEG